MPATTYTWSTVIIIHTIAASAAVLLGAWLLGARKGHRAHRIGGWLWVLCMATVAGLSFAIKRPEGYSWIHGLSVFTLITLLTGVLAARTHRVKAHRNNMIALYSGALIITGFFTLLPGRLIGRALWGWLG
ncbi:MAG: DUF2306 domain-containing protein [Burkholderiales bacterium]|jgi:uncharacterized membrane protein